MNLINNNTIKKSLILFFVLALSSCSLFPEKKSDDETEGWSAERLYYEAKDALDSGYYVEAVGLYQKLQARYPFGKFSRQAQLDLAYSYYKQEETVAAIAACNRFIKLYPTHPRVDYAYYLKGLSLFNQGKGLIDRYIPKDDSQRDPGAALGAFREFSQLAKRYPNSDYVPDARQRMVFLRNGLAQHEVNVAEYYLRRNAFVAAANRARYAVENYQQAPAIPDALILMAKAYKILGMTDLSNDAIRVLEENFPKHPRIAEVQAIRFN
ncbi:MAG: outer membrane protein assembly factor BamD [Gammaproteobacteria bacterium]